tara:strand:+ start:1802 stop:1909 length:108 start_codon:yes stop_codon:yes gene_type:complete
MNVPAKKLKQQRKALMNGNKMKKKKYVGNRKQGAY